MTSGDNTPESPVGCRIVPRSVYTARDPTLAALRAGLPAANARRFEAHVHHSAAGAGMPYRLFKPVAASHPAGARFPLLVLLHGAGGRGTDNLAQITGPNVCIGAGIWTLPENQAVRPCFVLVPQCPPEPAYWTDLAGWSLESRPHGETAAPALAQVMEILDELVQTEPVDISRIYLLGPSMGGFGTWDWIVRQPARFAAAVPICGGLADGQASRIAHMPIWILHGAQDELVPVSLSRIAFDQLTAAGGHPIYTEYQDGPHSISVYAWTEPGLMEWLFAQQLPPH